MTNQQPKEQQTYFDLETLVRQLINNRAGQHNSVAQLTTNDGKVKGKVIVDLQYNKQQGHHLLQIITPAELDDKHRGIANYTARFGINMLMVDVDALVKNVRTTASALLQLVDYLVSNMYVDFVSLDKEQQERQRQQLVSKTRKEGNRGVSG